MRRILTSLMLLLACAGAWGQTFSINRTSGSSFYIDSSKNLMCAYVSYQITNTGASAPDVWADIGSFGGSYIGKAGTETGYQHLGAMSSGQTKAAFFYLCSTTIPGNPDPLTVSESHTVRVLSNAPNLSPTVYAASSFTITQMRDTIEANANKVTVVTSGPNPPTIGGIITITVSGSTGTIGSPPFVYFTPASAAGWPADKIKLIGSSIVMSGGNNLTLSDTLQTSLSNTSTSSYVATYTFVAAGATSITTPVTPINYISSGAQVKHTDTSGLASLAPIQPVSSSVQVLKLVDKASLPATGGTVKYTLRIYNNSAGSVSLDQMVDLLPTAPGAVGYVPGSSKFNGVAIANPFISGSSLIWSGTFTVPGGGSADLTFDALVPANAGLYTNRGYGLIGTAQIDSTFAASDNAPASATTRVYQAASFTKSFSPNAIPPGGSGVSTLTFTISNPNPVAITGLAFTDALPQAPGSMSVAAVPLATTSNCGAPTFAPVAGATSISFGNGTVAANTICTITVRVTAGVSGTYSNTSSAATTAEAGSLAAASAQLTVTTQPAVVKSFSPDTIPVGVTSRLTLTVSNNNNLPLTQLAFSDPLPAGVTLQGAGNVANTCGGTPSLPAAGTNGTISLSGGTLGVGASCSLAVDVTAAASGIYTNVANGASSLETGAAGPPSPAQELTVLEPAAIAKQFSPNSVAVNERSTLTFTITNPNALRALLNVAFTDALPTSAGGAMTVASPSNLTTSGCGALATVTASGANVSLANGRISSGGTCTISVDVVASGSGTYNNATSAVTSDNGGTGNAAAASLEVNNRPSIAKAFSPTTIPATGTPATFSTATFTVTNNATSTITAVTFTDPLPAGLVVAPTPTASTTCTGGTVQTSANGTTWGTATAGHVHVRLVNAQLTAGASCTVSIRLTSGTAGSYANVTSGVTSSMNATPGNPSNTATLEVLSPAVTLTKGFNPSPVAVNGTTELTLTITNPNTVAVSGVAVQDIFPATPGAMTLANTTVDNTCGGTVQGTTNGTTWVAPAVGHVGVRVTGITSAANSSCTVTFNVRASAAGTYNNVTGAITATVGGFTYTGNTAGAVLAVNTAPSITKAFVPSSVPLGTNSRLDIVVTNGSPTAITSTLAFSDVFPTVPAQMTYVSTVSNGCGGNLADSGGGPLNAGDAGIQLTNGSVPASGTCTLSVNVAAPTAGSYSNQTSTVTASTGTGAASNTEILTVVAPPTISKAFGASSVALNGSTPLTLTFANPPANSATLTGLAVTDALPAGLQVAAIPGLANTCGGTVNPGATAGDTSIVLSGGTLAPGATCTVTLNVTGTTAGSKLNTTGAVGSANGGSGTTASATLDVVAPPTVAKAFASPSVGVNGTVVLTITITNPAANAVALTGVSLNDPLPAGLQVAATPALSNSCGGTISSGGTPGDTFVGLVAGTLPAAGSCQVQVTLLATTTGTKNNTTQNVQSANGGTGNAASASIDVLSTLTVVKSFSPVSVGAGLPSTVTIQLTNPNAATNVTGIQFTDTFPVAPGAMTLFDLATTNTCGGTLVDGTGDSLNAGDTGLRLTGGTLAGGASCSVTFNVSAPSVGTYTNATGVVASTTLGSSPGANANLEVRSRPVVAKSFGAPSIGPGQPTTLTITFANPNATPLTGLAFTDVFPVAPGAMTLASLSTSNTCGGTLTASGGGALVLGSPGIELANGTIPPAGCSIEVSVTASAPGDHVNTLAAGSVSTAEAGTNAAPASATLTVAQASIAKAFGAAAIDEGSSTTLAFTLANGTGNPAQAGLAFTETLPTSLRFTSATPTVTFGAGCSGNSAFSGSPANQVVFTNVAMAAGTAACTITIDGVTHVAGQANGSCVANPAAFTNQAANVTGLARLTGAVTPQCLVVNARPTLTKAFAPATVGVGRNSVLTFTITNPAGAPARTGLAFTDTLPGTVVIGTPNGVASTCGGTPTITATSGTNAFVVGGAGVDAAAGPSTCTITVNVASATAGSYVNGAAQVSALAGLTNGVTDQTLTVVQAALTKAFAPATIDQGGVSTLTFTLTNGAGNPAQSSIDFTDTLPANVLVASAPNIASTCPSGTGVVTAGAGSGVVTVTGASMNAAQATCTISVDVTSSIPGTYNNTDAANITAAQRVTTTGVNATLTVAALPTLTKAFSPTTVGVGRNSVLTFTISNPAGAPARTGLTFTDTLPAGAVVGTPNGFASSCGGTPTVAATPGSNLFTVGGTGIGAAAGPSTCTVSVNVTSNATGSYVNGAAQVTAIAGMLNGVTDQALTVTQASLTKAFAPAAIDQGGISTLTFTLTNGAGDPAQAGIHFTDTLPAGVVVAPTPNLASTCPSGTGAVAAAAGGGTITVSGASMNAAQSSCTISVDVTSNVAGTYPNTNAGNISATQRVTTTGVGATLTVAALPTLTKAFSPTTVGVGQGSVLTFTITNPAGAPARTGLTFTDTLPGSAVIGTPNGVTTTCGGTPTITATSGTSPFAVGGAGLNAAAGPSTCTISVNVASGTAGTYVNGAAQVTAIAGMLNGVTDQTLTVTQASLTKAFAPATIDQGGVSTLTFTLANGAGNPAQSGIHFTDTLPANVVVAAAPAVASTCPSGTGVVTAGPGGSTITVTGASMNAGLASCTISVNVTANIAGVYNNTNAANISATQRVTTAGVNATLTVAALPTLTKAFSPTTVGVGQGSVLTFTITNPAGAPARSGLTFTDTLPAGLVIGSPNGVTSSCGGTPTLTATAGTNAFTIGGAGVDAGAGPSTCTVSVNVTSNTPGAYVNGAAEVSAIGGMLNGVTNQTLTVTQAALTKAFAPAAINQGGISTLTFTLTNGAGNPAQSGIDFTDTLPGNVLVAATPNLATTCPSGLGAIGAAAGGGTLVVTGASMNAGQATCTISVDVTANVPGTYNNTNAGNISATQRVTTTGASSTLTVSALPTLTKAFSPATVGVGQNSLLTFTLTNPAGAPARPGLTFTDTLPPGAVIGTPDGVTSSCGGAPTVTAVPGTNTFTVGGSGANAAVGPSACTITVNVTSAAAGSYVNGAAQITAISGMLNAVDDQTLTVRQAALTKAFAPATISQGGVSTLTFTLTNGAGNPAQSGIHFTDTLPGNVLVAATPNIASTCPSGTGGVTAAAGGNTIAVAGAAMNAGLAGCTISVDVTSNVAGTYSNTDAGNITLPQRVTTSGVNATLTVTALPTLTKAFSPATVGVGQSSVLTFTITNPAGAPARTGLTFTDTLPTGAVIALPNGFTSTCGGTPTVTATPGTNVFSIGGAGLNAAAGASSCTLTVNVTSAAAGSYVNGPAEVTAISGMLNGVTNQTLTVTQAALAKAFAPTTIDVGGVSTLTFTLANGAGNPAQAGINFTDTLPAGVVVAPTPNLASTCPSGTSAITAAAGVGTLTVTGASMGAGQTSCTISVDVTSAAPGIYNNTDAGNISAVQRVTTAGVNATLTVSALPVLTKAFSPATVGVGQNSALTFTITNPAGAPARTGLTFTDMLPAGAVVGTPNGFANTCGGTPTVTAAAGTNEVTLGGTGVNAAAGPSTCTITVNVTSPTAGSYVNGTAQVSAAGGLQNGVTSQTLTVTRAALTKAFTPAAIDQGGISTLTFTLTNGAGNPAQSGIDFTDTLPANVVVAGAPSVASTCPSGTGAVTAAAGGGTVVVTGASMNAGQAACTISVNVTSSVPGTYDNTDAGNISATQRLTTSGVNATLTVQPQVVLTKAFAAATLGIGQATTLTFTIPNTGVNAVNRSAISFTDTLPAGLVIANPAAPSSANCGTPAFTAADGTQPFTASNVSVNAGQTCSITLTVRGTTLGTKTNDAASITAIAGAVNGVTAQSVDVVQASLAKAFSPATIAAGGTSTLTFTLTNAAGNPAQAGIGFTDNLPGNVRVAATPNVLTNCPAGGATFAAPAFGVTAAAGSATVTVAGASMGAATASCEVRVDVTAAIGGAYTNNAASITGTANVTNAVAPGTLTVTAPAPAVAKVFAPSTVNVNSVSTLTLTLSNANAADATLTAALADTLPGSVVVAPTPNAATSCGGAGAVVAVAGSSTVTLPAGRAIPAASGVTPGTCTVTVDVVSPFGGAFTNTIAAGALQTSLGNNAAPASAVLTVNAAAPTIAKGFAPAAIAADGTSTVTLTITNPNTFALTGAGFTDTLAQMAISGNQAAGGTCAGAAGNTFTSGQTGLLNFTGLTIPAAAGAAPGSCTVSFVVTSDVPGAHNNAATGVTSVQAPTGAGSNVAVLTVAGAPATIAKAFAPATIAYGATSTVTLTLGNANGVPLTGASFTDTLANMSIAGAQADAGSCVGAGANNFAGGQTALAFVGITIPANGTCTVTFTVTSTTPGTHPNATSGVATNEAAVGATSNTAHLSVTSAADLTITKSHVGQFTVGTNGTYTITVANQPGSVATSGVITVTDSLPAGLGFVSATGTGWTCGFVAPTVTCTTNAAIAGGASADPVTLVVSVASTAVPSVTNFATVAGGGEPAAFAGNNTASDNTLVVAATVNTFAPDNAQSGMPGTVVFYPHTFTAGSAGTVAFSSTSVQSPAVAGWTQAIYQDANCNGALDGAEGAAPIAGPIAVAAGASVCIVVRDSIPIIAPYNATNVTSVTSTFNGASTLTRTDTTTVGSAAGAGLTLSKTVRNVTQGGSAGTTGNARPNDVLEYTVTFANTGPTPVSAIVVTDATPAFTTYLSAACTTPLPAALTGCSVTTQPAANATGSVVWTLSGSLDSGGSGSVTYQVRVAP